MKNQQQAMIKYLNRIDEHMIRLCLDKCGATGFFVFDANCGSDIVTVAGEGIRLNVSARDLLKNLRKAKTKSDFINAINNA